MQRRMQQAKHDVWFRSRCTFRNALKASTMDTTVSSERKENEHDWIMRKQFKATNRRLSDFLLNANKRLLFVHEWHSKLLRLRKQLSINACRSWLRHYRQKREEYKEWRQRGANSESGQQIDRRTQRECFLFQSVGNVKC